jgi:hypothetical protein
MKAVLLGAGGTGTSFAIASRIRAYWGANVRLLVTDIFPRELVASSLLADAHFQVPIASDPSFRANIIDILRSENVGTYIPILNEEVILAADLAADDRFSGIDFWSSQQHARCIDKDYADHWLADIGVRTPRRYGGEPTGRQSMAWFAKPRNGSGSSGARRLSEEDIHQLSATEQACTLIQEACDPPEVTVDSFFDAATGFSRSYCRERLETKSGVCTKARVFQDTELSTFARAIGQELRQRGTICFQAMKSRDGWAVTDLNLRAGAGTAMTCAVGFDVLAAAFACRAGEAYEHLIPEMPLGFECYVVRQYAEFVTQHRP